MVIGIIGAFDEEVEKFIEVFKLKKEQDVIWDIYLGEYQEKKLVVCRSGIGKVNSGAMTQYLIDYFHVDLIINSGCAGSLLSKVKIMDVILSNYVTYHDFQPTRIMEYSVPEQGKVSASTKLIHIADSIGHICKLNHIPFLSVRTISDFSDGEEDFEVIAAYKSSQLVKIMIEAL